MKKNILYFALFISLVATLGSLVFSEILKFPPCVLCWYQRIAMYPLVAIFTVGILKRDKNVDFYAWPLITFGLITALFHNLLYYNIIAEASIPCAAGISCTTKFVEWFGFITIPLLSLMGFGALGLSMLIYRRISFKK